MNLIIISLLIIFSFAGFANENCIETYSPTNPISEVAGKNCLNGVKPKDLKPLIMDTGDLTSFCQNCNNKILNSFSEDKDTKVERANLYGKATLDELQKELSFITYELLQMRSTYKIQFNSKKTSEHCSIENIKVPKCLSPTQNESFRKDLNKIEASLATDIAEILKPEIKQQDSNQCSISDREILFATTKHKESLISPRLMDALKKARLTDDSKIEEIFSHDNEKTSILDQLKGHPLFKILISNPKKMNHFLKGLNADETNESIVEKLYQSDMSESFGDNIKDRCKEAYRKTNAFLDSIYCDKKAPFVADEFHSVQSLLGTPLREKEEKELESSLQIICSHNNLRTTKTKSFSIVQHAINGSSPIQAKVPISRFKKELRWHFFDNNKQVMCDNKDKCSSTKENSVACSMNKYLELARTSVDYKELAKSSSEDINKVLGSLIGKGLPQRELEGKTVVDTVALKNLRDEGILPGGTTTASNTTKVAQQDVATFQKKVSFSAKRSSSGSSVSELNGQMAAPTNQTTAPSNRPDYQNPIADNTIPRTVVNDTPSKASKDPTRSFAQDNDEFMRRSRLKESAASNARVVNNTQDSSTTQIDNSNSDASFTANEVQNTVSEKPTTIVNNFIRSPDPVGKKAVLDPASKPKNITNAPLIEANEKRQINEATLLASGSTTTLKPGDAPASSTKKPKLDAVVETSNVKEYQAKLQVLLNAQSKELSVEKQGESFLVKLKSYEIKVLYNDSKEAFEAVCLDTKIPKAYLTRITDYFNQAIPVRVNQRKKLLETLKASR